MLSASVGRNEVGRAARVGVDIEHLTGAEIDHQKRAGVRMEADAQENPDEALTVRVRSKRPLSLKTKIFFEPSNVAT